MNLENLIDVANENNPLLNLQYDQITLDKMKYGSYKILKRLMEIVIDPKAEDRKVNCPKAGLNTENFSKVLGTRRPAGAAGYYYANADDHYGPYGAVRSIEDLELKATEGERIVTEMVTALDLDRYMTSMRNLDVWTNTYIKQKYAGNLPKNKFSEWH